jgi:hypothetical protein
MVEESRERGGYVNGDAGCDPKYGLKAFSKDWLLSGELPTSHIAGCCKESGYDASWADAKGAASASKLDCWGSKTAA